MKIIKGLFVIAGVASIFMCGFVYRSYYDVMTYDGSIIAADRVGKNGIFLQFRDNKSSLVHNTSIDVSEASWEKWCSDSVVTKKIEELLYPDGLMLSKKRSVNS